MKKVAFYTLGCKLNFSETSAISRLFEDAGYQKVDFTASPDVFIINTCYVTDNADKKCRKVVKEALKQTSNPFIAIIGCYAQLKPEEIAQIPGVDAVLGASEKFRLLELLGDFEKQNEALVLATDIKDAKQFNHSYSMNDRTRTFLKVQDGCNYKCAFCTIPLARGKSRSDTVAEIVASAHKIAQDDVKEIVLTGVNIGDFGIQNGKRKETFLDLITALDEVEGIARFRISSIEPNLLTNDIIAFVASSKRFAPHFHIPLQSGSDVILESMRRRYLSGLYKDRIETIKELMPNACIGVDVIVGFPGETEDEFIKTYNFLNELDISYLHVFTYSERDNTDALNIPEVVDQKDRNRRSKMLRILSEKKKRAFYESQVGNIGNVLFEADIEDGKMFGFTENYIRVEYPYDPVFINELQAIKIKSITDQLTAKAVEYIPNSIFA